jgi:hypothetical protein
MKIVEYTQRAENGGFPAPNEAGFRHGEVVYIVSKLDFEKLLQEYLIKMNCKHERINTCSAGDPFYECRDCGASQVVNEGFWR